MHMTHKDPQMFRYGSDAGQFILCQIVCAPPKRLHRIDKTSEIAILSVSAENTAPCRKMYHRTFRLGAEYHRTAFRITFGNTSAAACRMQSVKIRGTHSKVDETAVGQQYPICGYFTDGAVLIGHSFSKNSTNLGAHHSV